MSTLASLGPARKPYNWRLLLILIAAILVSVILITPYSLALQANSLEAARLPLPLLLLLPIQWIEAAVLYGIIAAMGLAIAARLGLGLPFVESWLAGQPDWARVRRFVLLAMLAGMLAGSVILALEHGVFGPRLAAEIRQLGLQQPPDPELAAPAWTGFLASFYGGVTEEILLRLSVLSALAWIGRFANRTPAGRPGPAALWGANILAAILFGLGHLQTTAAIGLPIDALVVTRAIVLNGLGGLVFGWFYWTFGLEAAMVSHFGADLIVHVVGPLLAGH